MKINASSDRKKKKNALMLADTRPYLVGHVLLQVKKTNPGLFDEALIYYIDEIPQEDQIAMQKIMPCVFIRYEACFLKQVETLEHFQRFSLLMFPRYEMFRHLDEYETVTWTDTDVLIQGSLRKVIQQAKKTGMAANFEDERNFTALKPDTLMCSFTKPPEGYDSSRYNMCSGLLCVSDKLPLREAYTAWLYEATVQFADTLVCPDQGVLNLFIQHFSIDVSCVGSTYCTYPYYQRDTSKEVIVHSWGPRKFWNSWYLFHKYPTWFEYYQEWLKLGGSALDHAFLPRLSVVIPCYNPSIPEFKECLDSLLKKQVDQNGLIFDDFEVIIIIEPVNTAPVESLLESYHDPRIVLQINKQRVGIAKSLNIGISLAKGAYIARMDDDDIAAPQRLYQQMVYLDNHLDITLCTSDFVYFGDMNERRISFEGEMSRAWSIFTCPFDHPTIMFRKDFFQNNDLKYDESRSHVEDWELWLRAFDKGMHVGCIHEVLFYHRWHNGSAGQASKTIAMMRELIVRNFQKLGVMVSKEDLPLIGPWNGKLIQQDEYDRLEKVFACAVAQNAVLQIYNPECLERVLQLRLEEAKTGVLPGLVFPANSLAVEEIQQSKPHCKNASVSVKSWIRHVLKPLYWPIKRRYYIPLLETHQMISQVLNQQAEQLQILKAQSEQIRLLKVQAEQLQILKAQSEQIRLLKVQAEQMQSHAEMLQAHVEMLLAHAEQSHVIQERVTEMRKTIDDLYTEVNKSNASDEIHQMFKHLYFSALFRQKKIFLLGTSEHSNIGDAAIAIGSIAFINQYFPEYALIEFSTYEFESNYGLIRKLCKEDDLIFLQGGGNLGGKFLNEENLRRRVIQDFPSNRIVILPQTIYFSQEEILRGELSISEQIFNNHPNLLLFTRGKSSLAFARLHFPKAACADALDLALMLSFTPCEAREGILLCLRDLQDESGLTQDQYNRIVRETHQSFSKVDMINNLYSADIRWLMREAVVHSTLLQYARHKIIVTDRLHGMLFAIITHTPCVVLSAYNQKIQEFSAYFQDSNAVFFIDRNLDALPSAISHALAVETPQYPALDGEPFRALYDRIRNM